MMRFLWIYEETGGNISATCRQSGVSRKQFYRWTDPASTKALHVLFVARLRKIRPVEVLLDAAELTIAQKVAMGDLTAAMFVMNKLGHRRGWSERSEVLAQVRQRGADAAATAVKGYQMWLADNPNASESEKGEWFARFAKTAGVTDLEMIKTMKLQELTGA